MSASSVDLCSNELYNRLIAIISPNWLDWSSAPVVQEISILPSSSHPDIQYDPRSDPPAVGIPKALGRACFLRARSILLPYVERYSGCSIELSGPDAFTSSEWAEIADATAVILVWEPNHMTAINWRRQALMHSLRARPASRFLELGGKARCAERIFLTSLLTSPMPQHAKSSTLWAYRLQLLRASKESCKPSAETGSSWSWRMVEEVWREEVGNIFALDLPN